MKRLILRILSFSLLFAAIGCSKNTEPAIVDTFIETPSEDVEGRMKDAEEVVLKTYCEMSDGTWKADDHTYRYKLVITGRLRNAARDTTYTILSNIEDISFEQAWKASGLSSDLNDYFETEDAVFVAIKLE